MTPTASRKDITRHIVAGVGIIAAAAVIWTVTEALVIAFGGIVCATILLAISRPLASATGMSRRLSLVIVIVVLLAIVGLAGWLFGSKVAEQFSQLQERLPEATKALEEWLSRSALGARLVAAVKETVANAELASQASALVGAALAALGNILLILFLGAYFADDPTLYRDGAVRLVPPARRPQLKRALDDAGMALRKWLLAQIIAMVAVGTLTGVALAILNVPLALALGVVAGLCEFIPVIGPIVSAVPAVLLAFAVGPDKVAYVALVYVAVQQIESNVITPLVQRWAVKLPPVLGLLAIVACGLLFGIAGVIFAMPIAVVTMVLVRDLYVEDTLEKKPAR